MIGISYYAQKKLGAISKLELPTVGKAFGQNEIMGILESPFVVLNMYSPVSGSVKNVRETPCHSRLA